MPSATSLVIKLSRSPCGKDFVQTGEITKNLNAFTKALAQMAQDNQGDIHAMVGQMKEMTVHMNSIMTQADNNGERPQRSPHGGQYEGRQ